MWSLCCNVSSLLPIDGTQRKYQSCPGSGRTRGLPGSGGFWLFKLFFDQSRLDLLSEVCFHCDFHHCHSVSLSCCALLLTMLEEIGSVQNCLPALYQTRGACCRSSLIPLSILSSPSPAVTSPCSSGLRVACCRLTNMPSSSGHSLLFLLLLFFIFE